MNYNTRPDRNRPRKVVFYGRVSTEHEAQISALGNQMQWYDDQVRYHPNWNVVGRYIDEGISGTQAKKRPSFLRMIEDAHNGDFDLIVTREVCRFARNTVDTLSYTRELREVNVEVYFVEDNIWTMDGDGELRLSLMATLAQDESRKISERVHAGHAVCREKNILFGSGNILGYDRVGKTYVINEEQAKTVRMIFEMYVKGLGGRKIADELTRQGRLNSSGRVKWDTANIMRIIRNASYLGRVVYNKSHSNNYLDQRRVLTIDEDEYIVGDKKFEAIIDEDLFERANRLRKSKKKPTLVVDGKVIRRGKSRSADIWVNKLRCACGSAFRRDLWHRDKNGEPSWGYRCYNKVNNGSASVRREAGITTDGFCEMKMIPQWRLEMIGEKIIQEVFVDRRSVIEEVVGLVNKCRRQDKRSVPKQEDGSIKAEIKALENKLEELIDMRLGGDVTKEQYRSRKAIIEAKIEEKRRQLAPDETEPELTVEDNLKSIRRTLEAVTDPGSEDRTDLLDKIIDRVDVVNEHKFIYRLRYDKDSISSVSAETAGRKNTAVISLGDIEGTSDEVPGVHTIFIRQSCKKQKLCRLLSTKRSNSRLSQNWRFYAVLGRCRDVLQS